ncbi:Ras GTPase-activating protein SynGAP, partial [Stegodyphus mimosarum]
MLTESVSDPRRANWLTITSMSEDLCWPEEPNTSRPSWELEAEILRLTTRLMMRERELRQVKNQLKSQVTKTQQQAASWRRRMEEKEEQMRVLLIQKDSEMQSIVSQLLLFEAELRQEQSRIEDLLGEKDAQILSQQKEIERLRRCVSGNQNGHSLDGNTMPSSESSIVFTDVEKEELPKLNKHLSQDLSGEDSQLMNSHDAVRKLKDGLVKIRAIQDVTNVKSLDSSYDCLISEKKRVPYKAPQKMKDLKAKRINSHKMHRSVVSEISGQAIL